MVLSNASALPIHKENDVKYVRIALSKHACIKSPRYTIPAFHAFEVICSNNIHCSCKTNPAWFVVVLLSLEIITFAILGNIFSLLSNWLMGVNGVKGEGNMILIRTNASKSPPPPPQLIRTHNDPMRISGTRKVTHPEMGGGGVYRWWGTSILYPWFLRSTWGWGRIPSSVEVLQEI